MNKLNIHFAKSAWRTKWPIISRAYGVSAENMERIKRFKEKQAELEEESAASKAYRLACADFRNYKKLDFSPFKYKISKTADIVIIGGGVIGSAIAHAIKARVPDSVDLMVIEKDPKYTKASSVLSVGGIRQQFSLEENIKLSLYSSEFLRNIKRHLSVLDEDPPDVQFQPHGYLFLATEKGAQQMIDNYKVQQDCGAKVELLQPAQLKQKFPWLNVDGIELGSYGYENEGWFDPWALLSALKKKAISLGTEYALGEVIGFEFTDDNLIKGVEREPMPAVNHVYVKDEEDVVHCVEFSELVIAAGAYSSEITDLLQIGSGTGILKTPLPVEPRKRFVYVFKCENGPGLEMPLVIDPSGTYARREGLGGTYICGRSPSCDAEEPDNKNLEVDYNFFDSNVWPSLAHRIPAFEAIKVSSAWAGYYDYNTIDQNVIFGPHPHYKNVNLATGFSGHGIQMAPAIGRAMMELLIDKAYVSMDMSPFHFDRFITGTPIFEKCIV